MHAIESNAEEYSININLPYFTTFQLDTNTVYHEENMATTTSSSSIKGGKTTSCTCILCRPELHQNESQNDAEGVMDEGTKVAKLKIE